MKFTVSDFPAKGNELGVEEIVRLCQLAEEVGFDRFGITDFPFHFDCVALMAACLRATERIEVESLVTTPYARLRRRRGVRVGHPGRDVRRPRHPRDRRRCRSAFAGVGAALGQQATPARAGDTRTRRDLPADVAG